MSGIVFPHLSYEKNNVYELYFTAKKGKYGHMKCIGANYVEAGGERKIRPVSTTKFKLH